MSRSRVLALAALLGNGSQDLAASVVVVDKSGQGDFTELQPALNAAVAGDIVLVHPGDYSAMTISKCLTVIADPPGSTVNVQTFTIKGVPAGGTVVVRGIDAPSGAFSFGEVTISNCASPVWIEECSLVGKDGGPLFSGNIPGFPGFSMNNTAPVVATRCHFTGGRGGNPYTYIGGNHIATSDGGPGAAIYSGDVAFYDCVFVGAQPGTPPEFAKGGHGVSILSNGKILLSGCVATGANGPTGGSGLFVLKPEALVHQVASTFIGGAGTIQSGLAQSLPPGLVPIMWNDASRSFVVESPVAQGASVDVDLIGVPGDAVYLFVEPLAGVQQVPGIHGFLTLGLPIFGPFFLATINDPAGQLSFSAPAPALHDPALEGMTLLLDPLFFDGTTPIFGAPSAFVLVQ